MAHQAGALCNMNSWLSWMGCLSFAGLTLALNLLVPICTQCFRQTAPLWESRVAFREGPQKNGERANLALYFYKSRLYAGLTQA